MTKLAPHAYVKELAHIYVIYIYTYIYEQTRDNYVSLA